MVAAVLLLASQPQAPAEAGHEPTLPVVFVHGGAGSAAQYESQAKRFASNDYPNVVTALDRTSSFGEPVRLQLDAFFDDVLTETGADQLYVVGHSLGVFIMNDYLANSPERNDRVAKFIGVDGGSNPGCGIGDPNLECMGIFAGAAGNIGGNNVYFNGTQTHVQVATSAESFAAQYEFFTGHAPETTDILPEPPGQVEIAGRAVNFPANTGVEGGVVELFEVHENSGVRKGGPRQSVVLGADGNWGPWHVNGKKTYELTLQRPDSDVLAHYYYQPFTRDDYLVRLLSSGPDSSTAANTNVSENHSAGVIIRYKEWWEDHASGENDILEVVTNSASRGTEDAGNIIVPGVGNGSVSIHVHDDVATPEESSGELLPFFPSQFFQTGVDVFMPATDPPDGTISFVNAPRGDTDRLQTINVRNWESTGHRIVVQFNDYAQDINSWNECKKAKPSPCK
jgi:pimeloyl-ACP methyl ester carboxylesterase